MRMALVSLACLLGVWLAGAVLLRFVYLPWLTRRLDRRARLFRPPPGARPETVLLHVDGVTYNLDETLVDTGTTTDDGRPHWLAFGPAHIRGDGSMSVALEWTTGFFIEVPKVMLPSGEVRFMQPGEHPMMSTEPTPLRRLS